jgi:hypothetical protein
MHIPSLQIDVHRPHRWFGILAATQALLLASAALANQAPQSPAESGSKPTAAESTKFLKNNGFFRALHGYYFLENDRLHAYRELRKATNPETAKLEPVPENDEQRPLWKGEPYYHEVYNLENGEWMPKAWGPAQLKDRSFSQVPKRFLNFGGCDKKDLISVDRPEIKAALPDSAKIKKVARWGNYALVVYTDVPATRPVIQHKSWARPRRQMAPPKPTDRAVHVVLLGRAEKGKQKTWVSTHRKLDSRIPAYFCGTREVSTPVDGKTRPNLLVFSQQGEYAIGNSYTLWDDPRSVATK